MKNLKFRYWFIDFLFGYGWAGRIRILCINILHTLYTQLTTTQNSTRKNSNQTSKSILLAVCGRVKSEMYKCLVSTDRRACPGTGWVRRGRRCRDASGARPHTLVQTPGYSGVANMLEYYTMSGEAVPCSTPWGGGACSGSPRRSWCPPGGRCRGWSAPGTWP